MFQDLIIYIFGFSLLVVTVMHRILCFVCTIQFKHNNVIIINQFTSSCIIILKIAYAMTITIVVLFLVMMKDTELTAPCTSYSC